MEAMSRLVQQRRHVLGHASGVHEDERPAAGMQRVAIAAWCLPGARFEVEQSLGHHGAELEPKIGTHGSEDSRRGLLQFLDIAIRHRRRGAPRVDRHVPGPELLEAEPLTPVLQGTQHRRHHLRLDGILQARAIGRGVVKTALGREDVAAEVAEAGVLRHRPAQLHHPVEESREFVVRGNVRQVRRTPSRFADGAVVALEERRQPRQRHLLAAPLRRHRPGHLLVLRRQPFRFGDQRDIRLAEDLDRGAKTPQRGLQVGAVSADRHEALGERHLGFFQLRQHVHREAEVGRFLRLVGGVAGIGNHRERRRLGHQLVKSRPARQPRLERSRVERRGLELPIERGKGFPCRVGEAGAGFR